MDNTDFTAMNCRLSMMPPPGLGFCRLSTHYARVGRLELILFGTSLVGFRVLSAAAVSLIMVLAGLIAKELGGNRHVQLLAAIAAGIAPVSLIQGAVFQYVSFDYCGASRSLIFSFDC